MSDNLTGISQGVLKFKVERRSPAELLRGINGLVAKTHKQLGDIRIVDLSVSQGEDDWYVAYIHIERVEEYA